jgi:hypothetical protein
MKKTMLLAAMLALTVLAMGAPAAFADDDDRRDDRHDNDKHFFIIEDDNDFDRNFDGDFEQDIEQDADSGDVDQDFSVTSSGDNSNQCVGTQGVANSGNAQNLIDVVDVGDFDGDDRRFFDDDFFFDDDGDGNGDFEFNEVDSSIEVSPTNTTDCDQQVNQAASATG